MQNYKKIMAVFLAMALTVVNIPQVQAEAVVNESAVNAEAYTLSQKAGTYTGNISVKLKVKKGYRVYYTKNGKFTKKKVVKSGKIKTITIKKTTTLKLYVSKKEMSVKQLKKKAVDNNVVSYVYKIKKKYTGQMQEVVETAAASAEAAKEAVMAAMPEKETVPETGTAAVITFSGNTAQMSGTGVEISDENGMTTVFIKEAGKYVLTGGSEEASAKNSVIFVEEEIEKKVTLVLDSLFLDNSRLGSDKAQDEPVITIGKKTKDVTIVLKGDSCLIGNGSFIEEPASAVICAKDSENVLRFLASSDDASLTIKDSMEKETDFNEKDPSDGISTKGTLIMQGGNYNISVNGDCLKGNGDSGVGGVTIMEGNYQLTSKLANGIRSKDGKIFIFGGNIHTLYTGEDGVNAKNYSVNIAGGSLIIDHCQEDGIQGEDVLICGDDTGVDITTYFEDAGTNYYDMSRGSGNYNTESSSMRGKEETIYVDTGSHKGIKAGTKACTYQYTTVEEGSKNEAGVRYEQKASGGLIITGGEITINTKNTGIKFNGSSSQDGNQGFKGGNDEKSIIGSPDDALHSNHTCLITGGKLTIDSSDDAITSPENLIILNDTRIDISYCYEGMESDNIIIGAQEVSEQAPKIVIYTGDDGINASSKSSTNYIYADESEAVYTKSEVTADHNTLYMLDGYLNVMVANDKEQSFSLLTKNGETVTGTFRADGDGIDCNGSFYAYGGTVIVYGPASGAETAVDVDNDYVIGEGVTLLAAGGSSSMASSPTSSSQAVISYGMSGSGNHNNMPNGNMNLWKNMRDMNNRRPGGINGGGQGMPGGQNGVAGSVINAGESFAILYKEGNVVVAVKTEKEISSILYTAPELTWGETYTISAKGSVKGDLFYAESRYDLRYTDYDAENAQTLSEVTAEK